LSNLLETGDSLTFAMIIQAVKNRVNNFRIQFLQQHFFPAAAYIYGRASARD
jgi:hypothetical protein